MTRKHPFIPKSYSCATYSEAWALFFAPFLCLKKLKQKAGFGSCELNSEGGAGLVTQQTAPQHVEVTHGPACQQVFSSNEHWGMQAFLPDPLTRPAPSLPRSLRPENGRGCPQTHCPARTVKRTFVFSCRLPDLNSDGSDVLVLFLCSTCQPSELRINYI